MNEISEDDSSDFCFCKISTYSRREMREKFLTAKILSGFSRSILILHQ